MDKKIAGLLGAVAGVATLGGAAQAAPAVPTNNQMAVRSYADLLAPVPNAIESLKADDLARANQPADEVQVAQYYHHHHHHHHHHRYYRHHHHHRVIIIRRHHRHHHHHHHHHGAFIGIPGVGGVVVHH